MPSTKRKFGSGVLIDSRNASGGQGSRCLSPIAEQNAEPRRSEGLECRSELTDEFGVIGNAETFEIYSCDLGALLRYFVDLDFAFKYKHTRFQNFYDYLSFCSKEEICSMESPGQWESFSRVGNFLVNLSCFSTQKNKSLPLIPSTIKLIKSKISVQKIQNKSAYLKIERSVSNSLFNFQYQSITILKILQSSPQQ